MLALALGPASGLTLLGPSSGPTPHGSYVRTHFAWVLLRIQISWVLCQDPILFGLIICVINNYLYYKSFKKNHNFFLRLKNIKILAVKLNIMINIINIIVGFDVAAILNALGSDAVARPNAFGF